MTKFCKIVFVACLMLISKLGIANKDPEKTVTSGSTTLTVGTPLSIYDENYFSSYNNYVGNSNIINPANDKYNNTIYFRLNNAITKYIATDFDAEIKFNIEYVAVAPSTGLFPFSTALQTTNDVTLKFSYKKGIGEQYTGQSYLHFKNARQFKITITDIKTLVGSPATNSTAPELREALQLVLTTQAERDYSFAPTQIPDNPTLSLPLTPNSDVAKFTFGILNVKFASYFDAEWAWVEDEAAPQYETGGVIDAAKVFANNATRVTLLPTQQTDPAAPQLKLYNIPLLYDGTGKLYARVRAVSVQRNGTTTIGNWSAMQSLSYTGHEPSLNWQATTSFAEEGKLKTVIQYFDGSLRGRQTVTKDNVNNNVVIAETMYDYQGRPAIQILPAPSINTIIKYVHNYNRFENQTGDAREIYDIMPTGTNYCNAPTGRLNKMNANGGAAQYYSNQNPWMATEEKAKYIPDADGYAYTETRYTPDATGRIMAQSGVGATHQIGTNRETKYFYGSVDQSQLDALFGTEVGDAKHYFKNMVRDANGQYSVSYVDMHGRTIATALAGTEAPNTTRLANYKEDVITTNLLQSNLVEANSIVAATSLVVPKAGPHTFSYVLGPQNVELAKCLSLGSKFCYDCIYDLEIRIVNNCSGDVIVKTASNISANTIDGSCVIAGNTITVNFTETLAEGEYNVIKKLTIHQPSQKAYKDDVFAPNSICRTVKSFYDENYTLMMQNTNCNPTCEQCEQQLGTYDQFRNNYLTQIGVPLSTTTYDAEIQTAYTDGKAACDAICNRAENTLQMIRQSMLSDMLAGTGQYALTDQDLDGDGTISPAPITTTVDGITNTEYEWNTRRDYNIFNPRPPLNNATGTAQHPYRYPWLRTLTQNNATTYKNHLGQPDTDAHGTGTPGTPMPTLLQASLHTPDDFTLAFKDEWAEQLLPYHPEYCRLLYAEANLATAFAFERNLHTTTTYLQAQAAGYLTNLINLDPLFTPGSVGYGYRAAMLAKMNQQLLPNIPNISMWRIAWAQVFCTKWSSDPVAFSNCYTSSSSPSTPAGFVYNTSCAADWDAVWNNFVTQYLHVRTEYMLELITQSCTVDERALLANNYQLHFSTSSTLLGNANHNPLGSYTNLNEFLADLNNNPGNASTNVSNQITLTTQANAAAACSGYITSWKQALTQCPTIANLPAATRNQYLTELTQILEQICVQNSGEKAPFGASIRTINGVENAFDIAIKDYFNQHNIPLTALCHPYLINYPAPYGKQAPYGNHIMINPKDDCVCTRLAALQVEKNSNGFNGSLAAYVDYQYGIYVRPSLVDSLLNGCNGTIACEQYSQPISVPAILSCNAPEKTCLECVELENYKLEFKNKMAHSQTLFYTNNPTANELQWNVAQAKMLNYKTGLNYTWIDYANFEKQCTLYNGDWNCKELQSEYYTFINNAENQNLSVAACQQAFTNAFNQAFNTNYTYSAIMALYLKHCGYLPELCQPRITCTGFDALIQQYYATYGYPTATNTEACQNAFLQFFNTQMGTNYTSYEDLANIYKKLCSLTLDVCNPLSCVRLRHLLTNYQVQTMGLGWLNPNCEAQFTIYFNNATASSYDYATIVALYQQCGMELTPCAPPVSCEKLQKYIETYYNLGEAACPTVANTNTPEGCQQCLATYLNQALGMNYTYTQWMLMYERACGKPIQVCENNFDCEKLVNIYNDYLGTGGATDGNCLAAFTSYFNQAMGTSYTEAELSYLYSSSCGDQITICKERRGITDCGTITEVLDQFYKLYPDPQGYFGLAATEEFRQYFNQALSTQLSFTDVQSYYLALCGKTLNFANNPETLNALHTFKNEYLAQFGGGKLTYALGRDLFTQLFNNRFAPKEQHNWLTVQAIYNNIGSPINLQHNANSSMYGCAYYTHLQNAYKAYYQHYSSSVKGIAIGGYGTSDCERRWEGFYNLYCQRNDKLETIYNSLRQCGQSITVCEQEEEKYATLKRTDNTTQSTLPPRLCGLANATMEVTIEAEDPCDHIKKLAMDKAQVQYEAYKQQLLDGFDRDYSQKCLEARNYESFTVTATTAEYHYTLYYYDQAGNLVKTVPPAGVQANYSSSHLAAVATARANGYTTSVVPAHTLATHYRYNSLNQVVAQRTPDAGISQFYYDYLGRLVLSQNAKQAPHKYSYTIYDALGRISEVGEKYTSTDIPTSPIAATDLSQWLQLGGDASRTQITRTVYDAPYNFTVVPELMDFSQTHLRNRVSYTCTKATGTASATDYIMASFYSYDIHGNVPHLLQHYAMAPAGNQYKHIKYQYDLISGKVNEVAYQPTKGDSYYHRYSYDAENKLTTVATSRDAVYWQQDASYEYYRHGPLARVALGAAEAKVQGIDYAYTLQGWLKGVNSTAIHPAAVTPTVGGVYDIGKDGISNTGGATAKDAYSFSLNYYSNDYKAIDVNKTPFAPITIANDLYNGNIKAMAVNLPKLGTPKTYAYQYDQLNRIVAMDAYNGWNNANNSFAPQAITDYKERISYDANGNILTYQRNGDAARGLMDDMSYSYKPGTNQLDKVTDAATDVAASSYDTYKDIKQGQTNGNYTYDAIGNLISDASEGITNIEWTVYGKISKITKVKSGVTTEIIYTYDAGGNRITKTVSPNPPLGGGGATTTFYTRDASGNVMAVYEYKQDNIVQLKELHKYGSSRLGMLSISGNEQLPVPPNVVMPYTQANSSESFGKITNFTVGTTLFELTNHLGNALATISDRRIAIQSTTNTTTIAYYEADVVSATDYAPFGMALAGRQFSVDKYRYGFNGKENDKDAGEGIQDYGMRIYDGRLGKFLSVDPLEDEFPWNSVYAYSENDPINYIDLDGLERPGSRATATPPRPRPQVSQPNTRTISRTSVDRGGRFTYTVGPNAAPPVDLPGSCGLVRAPNGWRVTTPNGWGAFYPDGAKYTSDDGGVSYRRVIEPKKILTIEEQKKLDDIVKADKQFRARNTHEIVPQIEFGPKTLVLVENSSTNVNATNANQSQQNSKGKEFWVTYTKINPKTGQVYSGRTSGYYVGDAPTSAEADAAVRTRNSGHTILNSEKFAPAVTDVFSTDYDAIRGREQYLIDNNGGSQSDNGTSRNKIRGVGHNNPKKNIYKNAAKAKGWALVNNNPNKKP